MLSNQRENVNMKNTSNYSKNAVRISISHNYLVFSSSICVNMVYFPRFFCQLFSKTSSIFTGRFKVCKPDHVMQEIAHESLPFHSN